jgi:ParB/RepB/Spo0J family partition protein
MAARAKQQTTAGTPSLQLIPIDKIVPPPENRDDLGDLDQLAASIRARGVAQAVHVRPNDDGTYQIIFGERRWRAAKAAGLVEIKAEIRELDDLETALEQISENMDRKDLSSLEKAKALRRALSAAKQQGVRLGQRELAARLGKSQATVSKYLTLLALYTTVPGFQRAYDAKRVTDTDAVHLGKLVHQAGMNIDLIEQVLGRALEFAGDLEGHVNTEIKAQERQKARAKVIADLEAHGAILAPDDWRSAGARRLSVLGLDPEAHRSEPCHAAWVNNDSEIEPICMNPEHHIPPPASSPADPSNVAKDGDGGSPSAERGPSPSASSTAADGAATPSGNDDQAAAEAARHRQETTERQAREEAERRAREEAERVRAADLEESASKRRDLLRTWLAGSGRLPRPLTDRYLFAQVVNLLGEHTEEAAYACDLLPIEVGESGIWHGLTSYTEQGPEQLRRAALALVVTWAEGRLEAEEAWLDGFIQEHYRLLSELGYQPSEVETGELAKAQALGSSGDSHQDAPDQDGR